MNFRRMVFLLAVGFCMGRLAFSQTFEIEKKPPSVVLKDADGQTVTSVATDPLPWQRVAFSKPTNTFYVLDKEEKSKNRPRSLSAVNLTTRQVEHIDIPSGRLVELLMSVDGRRLFCFTVSGVSKGELRANFPTPRYTVSVPEPRMLTRYVDTRERPRITIIDTSANRVIGSYEWFDELRSAMPKAKFFADRFIATSDGSHLVADFEGFRKSFRKTGDRLAGHQVAIFSAQASGPAFTVDPDGRVLAMMLSQDESSLYVEAENKRQASGLLDIVSLETGRIIKSDLGGRPVGMMLSQDKRSLLVAASSGRGSGVLDVVDLATGGVISHTLTDRPTQLIRLGSTGGMWVLGAREMRSVSETGELGGRPIFLNKPLKTEGGTSSADVFLNGYAGETISLGEDHAAILITNKKGFSLHRVALLDLKQLQVDSIVVTMSRGQRAKIIGGRVATSMAVDVAMAAASTAAQSAMGIPLLQQVPWVDTLSPNLGLANEALAARPDGQVLYVLDTDTHEVTAVSVQTASAVARIPVDKSVSRLQVSPDGKYLSCIGTKPKFRGSRQFVQKIDLASNKMEN
jgi:hypothetical protein